MEKEEQIKKIYEQLGTEINEYIEESKKNKEKLENYKDNDFIFDSYERIVRHRNIKAFKIFDSIKEFRNYIVNLYNVRNWKISDKTYQERAEILKEYDYWHKLKKEFDNKNLLNKPINDNQIVSLFDTMFIMSRLLAEIRNDELIDEIKIIMEYVIPGTTKERVDYIISFRNQLLLLEFSKANNFNEVKKLEKTKKEQVTNYKERLEKYLNGQVSITVETCIYLPTTNQQGKELSSEQAYKVVHVIENLVNRASVDSFKELNKVKY